MLIHSSNKQIFFNKDFRMGYYASLMSKGLQKMWEVKVGGLKKIAWPIFSYSFLLIKFRLEGIDQQLFPASNFDLTKLCSPLTF